MKVLLAWSVFSLITATSAWAATATLSFPLTQVPAWDSTKLLHTLRPLDATIAEQSFAAHNNKTASSETPRTKIMAWSKIQEELNRLFAIHYPDAPPVITYLVSEIYQYGYPVLVLSHKIPFTLCTCHPLSFRTEILLRVLRDLTKQYPAEKTAQLQCVIIAPGGLLQEYILCNILQHDFNYKKLVLYLIDLEYEDPQFYPLKTKIVEQLPKELHGTSFEKIMRSPKKRAILLKHARDTEPTENEQEEQTLKALRAVLNTDGFSATVHHFQHTYGFIGWAQRNKIKPHLLLMVDPYPIDAILKDAINAYEEMMNQAPSDQTLSSSEPISESAKPTSEFIVEEEEDESNTYPAFSNLLLLKESNTEPFQYVMLKHSTSGVPTVWYERSSSRSSGATADLADQVVARIARKKGLSAHNMSWSTVFAAIEAVDPVPPKSKELKESAYWKQVRAREPKLTWQLESDPYVAFDDVAFSTLRADGIAYQSQSAGDQEAIPVIYPFVLAKEKARMKTGFPIAALQEILESTGFNIMTTPPSVKTLRKTSKKT
jgi:hypothetical protein